MLRSNNDKKLATPASHSISIVTNSELDDYMNQKCKTSDNDQRQCGLNVSPKSGEAINISQNLNTGDANKTLDTPILFLDVNFGNDKLTRIVMYKDDSPRELAKAFCIEHNLNDSKQEKLVKIIQQHLKGALERIVEEEAEEVSG